MNALFQQDQAEKNALEEASAQPEIALVGMTLEESEEIVRAYEAQRGEAQK